MLSVVVLKTTPLLVPCYESVCNEASILHTEPMNVLIHSIIAEWIKTKIN